MRRNDRESYGEIYIFVLQVGIISTFCFLFKCNLWLYGDLQSQKM